MGDDPQNCGYLGASCPAGSHCAAGMCNSEDSGEPVFTCTGDSCPAGEGCQTIFFPAICITSTCAAGSDDKACVQDAGYFPYTCCGEACVDLTSDPSNCGGCGLACPSGGVCFRSTCYPTACTGEPDGTACFLYDLPATCCGSTCTNLGGDSSNCGACGLACPVDGGFSCSGGFCVGFDQELPVDCNAGGSPCPDGWSCLDFDYCIPDCAQAPDGVFCGRSASDQEPGGKMDKVCCNHRCVDPGIDPANCGTCGRGCDAGEACLVGTCEQTDCSKASGGFTPCFLDGGGGLCCGGQCTDVARDPSNCGSCRAACPTDSSCDGSCLAADGGAPDAGCAGGCPAGTACVTGENICRPTTCGPNDTNGPCVLEDAGALTTDFGLCCDGACINAENDPSNCASCGLACGADGECAGGFCTSAGLSPISCAGRSNGDACFFGVSGAGPSTGMCCGQRCVDPTQDPQNCGGCGMASPTGLCPVDPSKPSCISQACADLSTDPQHCGACAIACPAGQTCSDGTCSGSPACGPGRQGAFCSPDAGLGATGLPLVCCAGYGCLDVSNDSDNCGSCGHACLGGQSCSGGACQ